MNVLFLSHIFPSNGHPAVGPYNFQIFNAISRNCSSKVIVPRAFWKELKSPMHLLSPSVEKHGALDVSYPVYWSVPGASRLHASAMRTSLIQRVKKLHAVSSFDVILAAWAYPDAVAASMIGREIGIPVVWNVLGSDVNVLTRLPGLSTQIKVGIAQASKVITVSDALKSRLVEIGAPQDKITTIHNGVDGKIFTLANKTAARKSLSLDIDAPLIVYVGRVSHEKGPDVLLDALANLTPDSPLAKASVAIVGGGAMEPEILKKMKELNLESKVVITGMRPPSEVINWFAASDLLCLPSRREGCPNAVLEALATGRPVVASRIGGVPELLNRDNGIMIDPDNPEQLRVAMETALRRDWNPQKLRDSVENLSWDEVGDRYFDVLEEAVRNHRSSRHS